MQSGVIRTLGILTSGGDSPGMNPAIRAVVKTAQHRDIRVFGFYNGYQGILDEDMVELDNRAMSGILETGGTILQSSRCKAFYHEAGQLKAVEMLRNNHIDGLVVIGGDGSLSGALALSRLGVPVIGLPGTIDNDLAGTDMGIGVDTAANTIVEMVDKIKDTARSHRRCFLVEVMGRGSGYLALMAAISTGAEVAAIPEFAPNYDRIRAMLSSRLRDAFDNSIIILAEGVCGADEFERRLLGDDKNNPLIQQEVRKTVLGHVQRGGRPSHFDRLLASRMGEMAVMGLTSGETGMMVGLNKSRLTLKPLEEVIGHRRMISTELLRLARNLGIEIGDLPQ